MFATPAITAIIIAIMCALSFGGGFAISDWRSGEEMARLQSSNAVLSQANDQCANDVSSVKAGVKVITDAVAEREKAASEAMKAADLLVAKHKAAQAQIAALPPVAPENQCDAIIQEQIDYVSKRGANGS